MPPTNAERIEILRLKYEQDVASLNGVLSGFDNVIARIEKVRQAQVVSDETAHKWAETIRDSAKDANIQIQSITDHVDQLNRSLNETQKASRIQISGEGNILSGGMDFGPLPGGEEDGGGFGGGGTRLPLSGARGLRYAGMLANQVGAGGVGTSLMAAGELEGVVSILQQIGPAAIPAAAGIGLLIAGIALFQKEIEGGTSALHSAIESLDAYYKAIEHGTHESLQTQLDDLAAHKANVDKELQPYKDKEKAFANEDVGEAANVDLVAFEHSEAGDKMRKLEEESKKLAGDIDGVTRAMSSAEVKTNSYVAQLDKEEKGREDLAQLAASGSSKQIESQLAADKIRQDSLKEEFHALLQIQEPTAAVKTRLREVEQAMEDLNIRDDKLHDSILPIVKAREAEAQAVKDTEEAIKKRIKLQEDINNIELHGAEQVADSQLKLTNQIMDATKTAADTAADAATKLANKADDLKAKLGLDLDSATRKEQHKEEDLIIAARRDEEKGLRDHLARLQQIKQQDQQQENEYLLDRNFIGLAKLRSQRNAHINAENQKFIDGEKDKAQALEDRLSDERRHLATERRERLTAYQVALHDAEVNSQRELAQINRNTERRIQALQTAHERELSMLHTSLERQLAARRQAYEYENHLAAANVKVLAALSVAAQKYLKPLEALAFSGIGKFLFGGGHSSNSSSTSNNMTFNINGGNAHPMNIAQAVVGIMERVLH